MSSLRVRLGVRSLMLGVAAVALMLWAVQLWRTRSECLRLAAEQTKYEAQWLSEQRMWEGQGDWEWPRSQANQCARFARHYVRMRQAFEDAARHPWKPVPNANDVADEVGYD